MLLNVQAWEYARSVLKPTDFYVPRYREIYEALKEFGDLITMASTSGIPKQELLELQVEGSPAAVKRHCHLIQEASTKRMLIEAADRMIAMGRNGVTAEQALTKAKELLSALEVPVAEDNLLDGLDLLMADLSESSMVVPGFLPKGFTVLAGRPKVGKSWQALNLATQLAYGGAVMGKWKVEPKNVLYLALEDTKARLQFRLQKALHSIPLPERLRLGLEMKKVDEGGLGQLRQWVGKYGIDVVIIDTLQKVAPSIGRGTSYQQDYAWLGALKSLADQADIAVVGVTHVKKADSENVFDKITGSNGVMGVSDAAMVLERKPGEKTGTLSITGRDIDDEVYGVRFSAELAEWRIEGEG